MRSASTCWRVGMRSVSSRVRRRSSGQFGVLVTLDLQRARRSGRGCGSAGKQVLAMRMRSDSSSARTGRRVIGIDEAERSRLDLGLLGGLADLDRAGTVDAGVFQIAVDLERAAQPRNRPGLMSMAPRSRCGCAACGVPRFPRSDGSDLRRQGVGGVEHRMSVWFSAVGGRFQLEPVRTQRLAGKVGHAGDIADAVDGFPPSSWSRRPRPMASMNRPWMISLSAIGSCVHAPSVRAAVETHPWSR